MSKYNYIIGSEESFKKGGMACKFKSTGDLEKDKKLLKEFYGVLSANTKEKFSDFEGNGGGAISFSFPDYVKEARE